jgi:hypothetical protein
VFHIVHFECPSITKLSSYDEDFEKPRSTKSEVTQLLSNSIEEAVEVHEPRGLDMTGDLETRSDQASDGSSVKSYSALRDRDERLR